MTNECTIEYVLKRMYDFINERILICHDCDSLFEWDGGVFPEICPICDCFDEYHTIRICTPWGFFEYDVDWQSYLGKGVIQFGWRKNAVVTIHLDEQELIFVDTAKFCKNVSRIILSDDLIDMIRMCFSYHIELEGNDF